MPKIYAGSTMVSRRILYSAIILLGILNYSSTQMTDPEITKMQFAKECVDETGIDPKAARKSISKFELPVDPNFKCFLKCMMQKLGEMTDDGQVTKQKAIRECVDATGIDADAGIIALDKFEIPDDPNFKCFIKCMLEKEKKITADGELIGIIPDENSADPELKELIHCGKNAVAIITHDPCEKALNIFRCILEDQKRKANM